MTDTIIIISLFVLGSALFSSAETAFSNLQVYKLEAAQQEKPNRLRKLVIVLKKREVRTITTVLIVNNIINLTAATYSAIAMQEIMGESGLAIGTAMITVAIIIFGEIIPKTLATTKPMLFAYISTLVLYPLATLITPISLLLNLMSPKKEVTSTENELKHLVNTISSEGVLEKDESNLIKRALDFDDIKVSEIMTPLKDVDYISTPITHEKIMKAINNSSHSRIPVMKKGSPIGLIMSLEYLKHGKEEKTFKESDLVQTLLVESSETLHNSLTHLRRSKVHMAFVVNSRKSVIGIVTLEDLIEQLVGEIYDETDTADEIYFIAHNCIKAKGQARINKLYKKFIKKEVPSGPKVLRDFLISLNGKQELFQGLILRKDGIEFKVEKLASKEEQMAVEITIEEKD